MLPERTSKLEERIARLERMIAGMEEEANVSVENPGGQSSDAR
jgi:hypothetical protein